MVLDARTAVLNAVVVLVFVLLALCWQNRKQNREKREQRAKESRKQRDVSRLAKAEAQAALKRAEKPFEETPTAGELQELLDELDPDGEMPQTEREDLMRKWEALTPEEMQMPTPKELQLNKDAYQRQIDEIQEQLKSTPSGGTREALLSRSRELRSAMSLLNELQDEMMMDIVLKKAAAMSTERQTTRPNQLINGIPSMFVNPVCPPCPPVSASKGRGVTQKSKQRRKRDKVE
eukprot:g2203.t1